MVDSGHMEFWICVYTIFLYTIRYTIMDLFTIMDIVYFAFVIYFFCYDIMMDP